MCWQFKIPKEKNAVKIKNLGKLKKEGNLNLKQTK